ncbi:MAG: NifU family protein [Phycisphaerae bacterium]|nr:NifU family protein [Phycisphaerae bacterium]
MREPTLQSPIVTTTSATDRTNDAPLRERVERVLNLIRPAVQSDGGDVELVSITPDGVVQIRLHGACVGCPSSAMTLQVGIERNLKAHVPEVTAVRAVG